MKKTENGGENLKSNMRMKGSGTETSQSASIILKRGLAN